MEIIPVVGIEVFRGYTYTWSWYDLFLDSWFLEMDMCMDWLRNIIMILIGLCVSCFNNTDKEKYMTYKDYYIRLV